MRRYVMSNSLFENIRLETKNLVVRNLGIEDAKGLYAVVSQSNVMKFLPEDVMTFEEVHEVIEWLLGCYKKNSPDKIIKWTLGIIWKKDSSIIGWCGLGPLDFNEEETEIFCGLSESFWGRGIAAEACLTVLDYAFNKIGLRRIVAVVDPRNKQSVRLIEKMGMQLEKRVSGVPEEFKHYEGFLSYALHGPRIPLKASRND